MGFELTTLVVIGIGSYKSNYHTITNTTVPERVWYSLDVWSVDIQLQRSHYFIAVAIDSNF